MLVTQTFVFIHLTKCAGTFAREALGLLDGPVVYEGRYHGSWDELPDQFRNMPVITTIRNPYDWWVSWYHFMKQNGWFNPIAQAAVDAGRLSFGDMIAFIRSGLNRNTAEAAAIDRYIQQQKLSAPSVNNDFNEDMINFMRKRQCGILSWRFNHQLGSAPKNRVFYIHQESLLDDLVSSFAWAGKALNPEHREKVLMLANLPRIKATSRDRDYRKYYDSEATIKAVAHLDRRIINRFDYKF